MRLRAFAAVVSTALAAISCGGDGGSSSPTTPTPVASAISIVGSSGTQAFSPNPAPVGGQSVVFRNNDSLTHRIVLNDGSADTGDIAPGSTSRSLPMPNGGTNFHCSIHPGMIGSVNAASGGAPPACEGIYCTGY